MRDEPIVFRRAKDVGVGGNAVARETVLETEMRVVHGRPCPSLTVWQALEFAVMPRAVRETASQLMQNAVGLLSIIAGTTQRERSSDGDSPSFAFRTPHAAAGGGTRHGVRHAGIA